MSVLTEKHSDDTYPSISFGKSNNPEFIICLFSFTICEHFGVEHAFSETHNLSISCTVGSR